MSWIRNKLSEAPKLDILTSINDIHNKLWNKQKVELVCLLGAKVGNVIKFREVELQVNNFVENYLPEKIDYFYKLVLLESFKIWQFKKNETILSNWYMYNLIIFCI